MQSPDGAGTSGRAAGDRAAGDRVFRPPRLNAALSVRSTHLRWVITPAPATAPRPIQHVREPAKTAPSAGGTCRLPGRQSPVTSANNDEALHRLAMFTDLANTSKHPLTCSAKRLFSVIRGNEINMEGVWNRTDLTCSHEHTPSTAAPPLTRPTLPSSPVPPRRPVTLRPAVR